MIRFVVLSTIIFLNATVMIHAQDELRIEKTVTLEDIAYPTDILLQGYNPEQDFYFEVPGDRLKLTDTYIRMNFRFSEALGPNTLLNIQVNGHPAKSVFLRDVGYDPVLYIPMDMFPYHALFPARPSMREEYIRVSVTAVYDVPDLSPGLTVSPALWMIIENSSYVQMSSTRNAGEPSITGFLGQLVGDVHVVVPTLPTGAILKSVVWMTGDLQKRTLYSPRSVSVSVGPDDAERTGIFDYIVIAKSDEIAGLPGPFTIPVENYIDAGDLRNEQGAVILHTDGNMRILYLTGKTEQAVLNSVRGFLNESSRVSMLGRVAIVPDGDRTIGTEWPEPPYTVSFERLGYESISLSGKGGVRRSLQFRKQSIGAGPRNLVLHLSGTHSEIPSGDNVYMTVYINNIVAGSWRLDRRGYFENKSVRLRNYILQPENELHFEFVYIPAGDRDIPEFILHIDNSSYVEVRRSRPARQPEFSAAMEQFHKPTALVLSNNDAISIMNAASLMSAIDRDYNTRYLYPEVYLSNTISRALFDTTNVIAVLRGDDPVFERIDNSILINPQYPMKIRNVQTRDVMFELTPDRPFAIMQVMRPRRSTFAMLATSTGNDGEALIREFIDYYRERPQMLEGDIALYGGNGEVIIFNTSAGFAEIDYPHRKTFISTVRDNRFVIFLVLWIVFILCVVALALYARRRSYKSVEIKSPY